MQINNITTKTDWTSNDCIDIDDYNRIKGNIEYIHDIAEQLYRDIKITAMSTKYVTDWYYSDDFNVFENNLDVINHNVFTQNIGNKLIFVDNGIFIDYVELNRIEKACIALHDVMKRQAITIPTIAFTCGNYTARGIDL